MNYRCEKNLRSRTSRSLRLSLCSLFLAPSSERAAMGWKRHWLGYAQSEVGQFHSFLMELTRILNYSSLLFAGSCVIVLLHLKSCIVILCKLGSYLLGNPAVWPAWWQLLQQIRWRAALLPHCWRFTTKSQLARPGRSVHSSGISPFSTLSSTTSDFLSFLFKAMQEYRPPSTV